MCSGSAPFLAPRVPAPALVSERAQAAVVSFALAGYCQGEGRVLVSGGCVVSVELFFLGSNRERKGCRGRGGIASYAYSIEIL